MLLRRHRIQRKRTYYYQKLSIYYEIYQLTETLLSGKIRNLIDTYKGDYCLVENYKPSFLDVFQYSSIVQLVCS